MENYLKFLQLHQKLFNDIKNGTNIKGKNYNDHFYDVGSSLLVFGSKKLYRKYLFYREITTNPIAEGSKYFDEGELNLYLLGDILIQIRKELALELNDNINEAEALSFFVNGFANNPLSKIKLFRVKHSIRMIKLELFFFERFKFVLFKKLYYLFLATPFGFIALMFKYIVLIPVGKFIICVFPKSRILLTRK